MMFSEREGTSLYGQTFESIFVLDLFFVRSLRYRFS